jgi:hypothetical protein
LKPLEDSTRRRFASRPANIYRVFTLIGIVGASKTGRTKHLLLGLIIITNEMKRCSIARESKVPVRRMKMQEVNAAAGGPGDAQLDILSS